MFSLKNLLIKLGLILLFFSCSDNGPVSPDYEFYIGDYNILVELDNYSVSVSSRQKVNSSAFSINGIDVPLEWKYSDYLDEWYSFKTKASLDSSIDYSTGKDFDIHLNINGKEYNATIHLSDIPVMSWPDLSMQSDFTFSWDLTDIPYQQTVYMSIDYDDGYFDRYWHLDGDIRSHTIKKKYLKKLNNPESDLWVYLSCYNKVQKGKFIVIADCWVSSPFFELNP